MLIPILAGVGLLIYLIAAWFLGTWLVADPTDRWVLRIGLWLLGLTIAAVGFIFWRRKQARASAVPGGTSQANEEIQFLTREANRRLASSAKLRGSASNVANLPLVLLLGETGSTKTTAIVKSGLDAELLSGQDRAEGVAIPPPTKVANFWLAAGAVFVEASGAMLADRPGLAGLVRELKAAGMGNLLGRTAQAPRAVIVCCDAETLTRGDAAAILAAGPANAR
jgi:type VI protein secretion system component VasK